MTQIVNLPALTTITNSLVFPAADTSDGNKTKKVTLDQLIALSAGPVGPVGPAGELGPSGPTGPIGPGANQSLNTSSAVTFVSMTLTNQSSSITFSDGSIQNTAYIKSVRDLTEFSTGNISFTEGQLIYSILSGNPSVGGRNLYLPTASVNLAGIVLIIRNRSNTHTFSVWGGLGNLGTVSTNSVLSIACDGFTWFVV